MLPVEMVAAAPLFPMRSHPVSEEQRVLLRDVPWSTYVVLRDSIAALKAYRDELRARAG
jgi:hypothetical protein